MITKQLNKICKVLVHTKLLPDTLHANFYTIESLKSGLILITHKILMKNDVATFQF